MFRNTRITHSGAEYLFHVREPSPAEETTHSHLPSPASPKHNLGEGQVEFPELFKLCVSRPPCFFFVCFSFICLNYFHTWYMFSYGLLIISRHVV